MAAKPTIKQVAWALFDRIVERAEEYASNPWLRDATGELQYEADYETLHTLLGVPLHLKAPTTSGVPALALDVWLAYEFRRAGFNPDAVWPRSTPPRVLPASIARLLEGLPAKEAAPIRHRLAAGTIPARVVAASANILGKNYVKQVDVGMSDWMTGPELLISTKRMDSSFGKNAANRVEESYGDAKNLRLRHPYAALGFVYGLRTTIYDKEADKARWLIDLLGKLGREDDAYHAVALLMLQYDSEPPADSTGEDAAESGPAAEIELDAGEAELPDDDLDRQIAELPEVRIDNSTVPTSLRIETFLKTMCIRILDDSPVDFHSQARTKREDAFNVSNRQGL